ncbi:MAG: class I SAM-dependent methyltransferase [Clostridiales bacterium]|nr:class I SAM-dependent methyltransferase [Clostridiales bacterium]
MTPLDKIVEIGFTSGMNQDSFVLDLCCGYGEMLKVWHQAFGIKGIGVDICKEFIDEGKILLKHENIDDISLIEADVLNWKSDKKFDYVCLSGEDFGGFERTIQLLEQYVKPNGKLIIGTRFSKVESPPMELIEFEGETLSLRSINEIVRKFDYFITSMASDTDAEWERYIMWSARRHLENLRNNPNDENCQDWCEKWYTSYFGFRRKYEGYVLLVIEKL